jgi:hypothetical protein
MCQETEILNTSIIKGDQQDQQDQQDKENKENKDKYLNQITMTNNNLNPTQKREQVMMNLR